MKLARFTHAGVTSIGKIEGDRIIDLAAILGRRGASMRALLTDFPTLKPQLEQTSAPSLPLSEVRLEAPIDDPQKFLAIGMNYKAHADEAAAAGIPTPKSQFWFNKQVSCITGPYDDVVAPKDSEQVDYEAELAFVIGKRCRHVRRENAREVIAGYMVCNDVTARDWQFRSPTYTLGKSFDTHGPVGPWLTTDDEIADPLALELSLTVNGEERQRSSTGDMIYNIYEQIEYLSTVMTLEPGDLITTGTPSGVGIALDKFLKPGDEVRVEISELGHICNRIVAEES
ncbi:fumarylacetoacetate hydrolase family protein [Phenylobacterium montanum]|uniref:Fumarylacetoacetate hydrolase family protein n=1 Tax=Phenylobacterium montanum TaxID=2823693 RepID=A0A975G453_9CAUL|nr:fumarylacetoacetate hydrolase family protein [Caulobacter sp. S6]QUD90219.1 fumarylacetoacetate hydrolase family protein [Caulobacter sp. S6]